MKKQVVSVSILQNAKVMAALYFVISIPFTLLMFIPALMGQGQGVGPSLLMLLMMPLLYTLMGFVFTLIGAWVYNIIAARIGGLEFTTAEVAKD
ncbi:MAG TPA: hypothetical protein DDX04_12290 [Massilia sp.]|nr:hypothetical protein [Massilia sp.]